MSGTTNKYIKISYAVKAVHYVLWIACIVALVACGIYQPWYITILFVTMMSSPFVVKDYCYLQILENHYRVLGGLQPLDAFYDELVYKLHPVDTVDTSDEYVDTFNDYRHRLDELRKQLENLRES